ncbi:MAG TPA: hypothetical protein VE219_07040 [Candidatus Sulfotelmatobacter sp.]|nr:hypothetical protein [Candidatus Sulfotelmatobacter sp.]
MTGIRIHRLALPFLAAILSLAGAACGSSSESSPSSSTTTGAPLAIQGADFRFGAPSTVSAGLVNLTFSNHGQEEHEAQLLTIDPGHTADELYSVASTPNSQPPTWAHGAGGAPAVEPGASDTLTQVLTPGTYYILCLVSGSDNIPHVAKGMHSVLTVTGAESKPSLPSSSGTVVAQEYSFKVPSLKAGRNTIEVRNDGPRQLHEWGLIKLAPGFTVDKLKAALSSNGPPPPGPPPFTGVGGVAAYDPGGTATFDADLQAGANYAFICFAPDHAGEGPPGPHAARGMIAGFTPT